MLTQGDILRLVLTWLIDNETTVQQVWHYLFDTGTDRGATQALAAMVTAHQTAWDDHLGANVANNVQGLEAELYRWNSSTSYFDGVASQAQSLHGLSASEMLPNGVACLVKYPGEVQRYQGRKYVAGLTEAHQSENIWTAPALADVILWATDADDDIDDGARTYVAGVFNAAAQRFTRLSQGVIVSAIPAYQRRRRTGVGV